MRILFISPYFPSNVDQAVFGVHQRMGMFIAALKSMAQLDVLFYVPFRTDTSDAAVGALERALSKKWDASLQVSLCTNFNEFECLSLPRKVGILTRSLFGGACNIFSDRLSIEISGPRQLEAFEACLRRKPDAIFAHRLGAMGPILRTNQRLPPVFFDLDDVEHVKSRQSARQARLSNLRHYAQTPIIYWAEYRAIRRALRTFVCSDNDRDHLRNLFQKQAHQETFVSTAQHPNLWNLP